jgi:rubrerythrin
MSGCFRKWIMARIVKSALVFEKDSIKRYRGLLEKLGEGPLRHGLGHLLEEEEMHRRILADASRGKLDPVEMENSLEQHLYANLPLLSPLSEEALGVWGEELSKALEREKETFVFYGNLRRMSKIPAVKKAFEALADMEREHMEILSKLLGRDGPS